MSSEKPPSNSGTPINPLEVALRLYAEGEREQNPDKLEEALERFDEAESLTRFFRGVIRVRLEGEDMEEGLRDMLNGLIIITKTKPTTPSVLRSLLEILEVVAGDGLFEINKSIALHEDAPPSLDEIHGLMLSASQSLQPRDLQRLHRALSLYLRRFSAIKLGGKIV